MNWVEFLEKHNIHYVTHGSNVATGNINIKCPFCGESDSSEHLGINLKTNAWGCWRSSKHRGKDPTKLVAKLLAVTYETAKEIIEEGTTYSRTGLKDRLIKTKKQFIKIELLEEFHKLKNTRVFNPFCDYLFDRGFTDVEEIVELYNIHACFTGDFQRRLILPFTNRNKVLYGWTGRHIGDSSLRYKTYPASSQAKDFMYNSDNALGGDLLLICEGTFDALKLDYFSPKGVNAVACLSVTVTENQLKDLYFLIDKYKKVAIILDNKEYKNARVIKQNLLSFCNPKIINLKDFKDPGDMDRNSVINLIKEI